MYMHIGKMIHKELRRSGMTVTAFADALACHRQNVYKIFNNPDINTNLLFRYEDYSIDARPNIKGGFERGPVGNFLCSGTGAFVQTLRGILGANLLVGSLGIGSLSAFFLGVATECYLS